MTKRVELLFDIVSPNAYLAYWPLKDIAARHGAELVVTPVFLAGMHKLTGNAPPFIRDAEVKGKNEYAILEINRFIAAHGLTEYTMNPKFPFNSVLFQRLLCTVEGPERLELADALLRAVWHDGKDPTAPEAVASSLQEAGFDAARMIERTQDPAIRQALMDNTQNAVDRGAFGIPTMFVHGAMFFGKERLGQIETELERQS
ncbi:MAG: 2-hydroxychromene-2-carboxylate isomerase [Pontixanthobacter sp.]